MLLRRIIEHVKTQNWTAIVIDFFIVVVGVFIGIQVSNWNASLEDRKQEREYLERLYVDLNESVDLLTARYDMLKVWQTNGEQALAAIMNEKPEGVPERSGFYMQTSTRIAPGIAQMATIQEIISSGGIRLFRNPQIRIELSRLDSKFTSLSQLNNILVDYASSVAPVIQTRLTPGIEGTESNDITYEFDELVADNEFQNAMGFALGLQENNLTWIWLLVEDFHTVRTLIANEIGVEPPKPPQRPGRDEIR